ncbi:hypothetical protein D3C87_1698970 [compost metagenome]
MTTLKADWKVGLSIAEAICSWAGTLSAATLNMANWSELKVTDPCVPGKRMQTKSVPGTFLAFTNSPLAQSPMNCRPALFSMTMAEARFQSRPEKLSST